MGEAEVFSLPAAMRDAGFRIIGGSSTRQQVLCEIGGWERAVPPSVLEKACERKSREVAERESLRLRREDRWRAVAEGRCAPMTTAEALNAWPVTNESEKRFRIKAARVKKGCRPRPVGCAQRCCRSGGSMTEFRLCSQTFGCGQCGPLPLSAFSSDGRGGKRHYCKQCERIRRRELWQAEPDRHRDYGRKSRRRKRERLLASEVPEGR